MYAPILISEVLAIRPVGWITCGMIGTQGTWGEDPEASMMGTVDAIMIGFQQCVVSSTVLLIQCLPV